MIPFLTPADPFPPVHTALKDPNGLLAAGADLSPERLIDAYSRGIFPWFSEDEPLLWWSPDPRMVLRVGERHVSRSLRRRIRAKTYTVTTDTRFAEVMAGCAGPRRAADGTWITGGMIDAYTRLHDLGHAHSIEAWRDGELAGGLYGVAVGRMFFGESMFTRHPDASKVAIVHLACQLERWGFEMIDCQMTTSHLLSLGAREIPRSEFLRDVRRLIALPAVPSPWRVDPDLSETF